MNWILAIAGLTCLVLSRRYEDEDRRIGASLDGAWIRFDDARRKVGAHLTSWIGRAARRTSGVIDAALGDAHISFGAILLSLSFACASIPGFYGLRQLIKGDVHGFRDVGIAASILVTTFGGRVLWVRVRRKWPRTGAAPAVGVGLLVAVGVIWLSLRHVEALVGAIVVLVVALLMWLPSCMIVVPGFRWTLRRLSAIHGAGQIFGYGTIVMLIMLLWFAMLFGVGAVLMPGVAMPVVQCTAVRVNQELAACFPDNGARVREMAGALVAFGAIGALGFLMPVAILVAMLCGDLVTKAVLAAAGRELYAIRENKAWRELLRKVGKVCLLASGVKWLSTWLSQIV